jgi:hypothetical protein
VREKRLIGLKAIVIQQHQAATKKKEKAKKESAKQHISKSNKQCIYSHMYRHGKQTRRVGFSGRGEGDKGRQTRDVCDLNKIMDL